MSSSDQNIKLDAQNPWPGLPAYNESGHDFFYGRDEEANELLRLVRLNPLTALYSKSGLGKSSLLQAGLFPRLRDEHFLPVYILLDVSEAAEGFVLEQVSRKLQKELEAKEADFPAFEPGESLWHYLHRRDLELWSKDNFILTPVLVFDQFEEIFSRSGAGQEQICKVFYELADLIENRIPVEFVSGEKGRLAAEKLDLSARNYHIVLSFREDFLPDIRNWERDVPSLLKNWLQIQPLSQEQAKKAVQNAGKAILADDAAEAIVKSVSSAAQGDATDLQIDAVDVQGDNSVEPVLLSLCCYQLNRRRKQDKLEFIDANMVDRLGQDILQDFYNEALSDMPKEVAKFIEDELIQGNRYRSSYPLNQAKKEGRITQEQLNKLIGHHRLLRIDRQRGVRRIELIHDRLVGVVSKVRDQRLAEEMQREEAERRQQAEERAELERARADAEAEAKATAETAAKKLGRQRKLLGYVVGILCVIMVWGVVKTIQASYLQQAFGIEARRSVSLQLAFSAQGILDGSQTGSDTQAYLQILAANQLMPDGEAEAVVNAALFSGLRDIQNQRQIIETRGAITAITIDKEGKTIATGFTDGSLRLWKAETGQPVGQPLWGHGELVTSLAFNTDGTKLVSGSNDKTLRLWDAKNGKPIGEPLTGHGRAVTGVAFSPDGKKIASSSHDQTLRLWDADTLQTIGRPLTGQGSGITSVAFNPDGTQLVSGSVGKALQLWDVASQKKAGLPPLLGHEAAVTSVAFSPNGAIIVSGSEDQTVRLWDAKTGEPVGEPLKGHEDIVTSVAFNLGGNKIASSSQDQSIRLWDTKTGRPIRAPLRGHSGKVSGVVFGPDDSDDQWLASGGYDDNTLRLWNLNATRWVGSGHDGTVAAIAYSPNGKFIVSGSYDKTLRLWDAKTGEPVGEPLKGHQAGVSSVAFSPDGKLIVSGSYDKTLRLWDAKTGDPLGKLVKGHSAGISSVAFSPDGERIVSGSDDGTVRLWDTKNRSPVGSPMTGHNDVVSSVAFSRDGTKIVSGSFDKNLRLWNTATGKQIGDPLVGHDDAVTSVAFGSDDNRIVSGSYDKNLRLWRQDAKTGSFSSKPMSGHTDWVTSVAFSRDGNKIVSGSRDQTLRVWSAQTGKPEGIPFRSHKKGVWSVAFSPDGAWIASGSADKTLQTWPATIKVSADELCKKLSRNMSYKEWNTWVSSRFEYRKQCPGLPISPDEPEPASATEK
ncbi:WD40 repeat protein [Methylobacter tundripaludum]|uniref:WD40 repeat protein n=1 Tax=Methylobacter tundripaludum TaxID=173365 RepID=A0A2S6H8X2_9GAMM|nr:WD40 repeat domain-containing protein [Methylobacter tundripaludum]PPK73917.1 WD40 repeat protein [Methylobacter tundripaludum]